MKSLNIRYLPGVDHLRAAAAVLVIFYHGLHELSFIPRAGVGNFRALWVYSKNPFIALVEEGHTAVSLFMVLSGFVLTVGAIGRDIDYWPFLRNRFLRIYPLLMMVALAGIAAHPTRFSFPAFAQTLLFQANLRGALAVDPFSTMFWALSIEFQFYLLLPFLHRFVEREGVRWALAAIAVACMLRLAAVVLGKSNPQEIYYWHFIGRFDQFLLGMLAARVYHRYQRAAVPWGLCSIVTLSAALAAITLFNQLGGWASVGLWKVLWPTLEGLAWAAVITTYVPFAERLPALMSVPLARIGTISYSMYLLHSACISALPLFIPCQLGPRPNLQSQIYVATVVLPVVLLASTLTYYAIERPFLRLRVKYHSASDAADDLHTKAQQQ